MFSAISNIRCGGLNFLIINGWLATHQHSMLKMLIFDVANIDFACCEYCFWMLQFLSDVVYILIIVVGPPSGR
jgi:hypothetical protein